MIPFVEYEIFNNEVKFTSITNIIPPTLKKVIRLLCCCFFVRELIICLIIYILFVYVCYRFAFFEKSQLL